MCHITAKQQASFESHVTALCELRKLTRQQAVEQLLSMGFNPETMQTA